MNQEFLSEQDLATRWAMSSRTLTHWRCIRRGPPFVKLGKTVRYAISDVLEFERHGLRKSVPRTVSEGATEVEPQERGPQLTVRDVVERLNLGDCDGDSAVPSDKLPPVKMG